MDRYIDMHCHILPGVDDGAQNLEETRKMLQIAFNEGTRLIIATPHHHPRRGHKRPEILNKQLRLVRAEAAKISDKFRIYLGTEVFFGQDVPEKINRGEILTMNKRNTVLLEFSPSDSYDYIRQGVQQVQMTGNQVIIAHAERYQCLLDDIGYAEELCDMGASIQVNAGSIIGDGGRRAKRFVKELMDEDMVFGVGTDAHGVQTRAPKMKKAADYVKKKYGEEYMRRIFFDNAATLLRKRK